MGASINLRQATRWRAALRPGYYQRVSGELNTLLKPGVHQWIIDAANRNSSPETIETQIRRGLDPLSITGVVTNVNHALKMTYRRRRVLHQAAAMLITLVCMLVIAASDASNRIMRGLLTTVPTQGVVVGRSYCHGNRVDDLVSRPPSHMAPTRWRGGVVCTRSESGPAEPALRQSVYSRRDVAGGIAHPCGDAGSIDQCEGCARRVRLQGGELNLPIDSDPAVG